MLRSILVVPVAVLFAGAALSCASSRQLTPDEQAQRDLDQAQQNLSKAQQEEKDAVEQHKNVVATHEQTARAQQQLAEAQQRENEARSRSTQLQRDADQHMRQANDQAQRAQTLSTPSQPYATTPPQQPPQPSTQPYATTPPQQAPRSTQPYAQSDAQGRHVMSGRVVDAEADQVVVESPGGQLMTFDVGDGTRVFIDGQQRRAADLHQGDDARVAYDETNGNPSAVTIQTRRSATTPGSETGTGSSFSSPPPRY